MQVNRVGIWLIAFFGIFGLAFVAAGALVPIPIEGRATFILLGAIWFLVALGLGIYARRQKRKAAHQDWVFANGIKGTATVLEAGSHATVNDMPLMKLKLELDVPGEGKRQLSRREVMPVFTANRMQPGLLLPVHVNPGDPNDFILVW